VDRAQALGERVSSARREPGLERSSSFFSRRRWVHLRVHVCYADATAAVFSKRVANVQQWCIFLHFRVAAICYNTRQWYIADSAPPGTPFTMDSYSLGACRRLDAITPVAATVSTCLHGPVCTNTCRHP